MHGLQRPVRGVASGEEFHTDVLRVLEGLY